MSKFYIFNGTFKTVLLENIDNVFSTSLRLKLLSCENFIKNSFLEIDGGSLTEQELINSAKAYETLWEQNNRKIT